MVWYSRLLKNFPQFVEIHTVKGFDIVNKAEVDVLLALSCFFDDPADVGNFISGSSAFSKTSLNIWKFTVHVVLKPGLENFEHYFASVWDECNCAVVWAFAGLPFLGIGMKTDLFQSCGHCWVFQMCWHIECSTFTASSFKIWNSATGIPSPPLALFVVMLPRAHLTTHSRRSGSRWVITPLWLSGLWSSFLYISSVYFCHLFFISSASVRSIPFLSFIRIDQYQKMDKRNDVKYIWTFFHNQNIEDKNWTYKMTLALAWWTLNSRILSSFRELVKFGHGAGGKDGEPSPWQLTANFPLSQ